MMKSSLLKCLLVSVHILLTRSVLPRILSERNSAVMEGAKIKSYRRNMCRKF